jgi:hypothetical protein
MQQGIDGKADKHHAVGTPCASCHAPTTAMRIAYTTIPPTKLKKISQGSIDQFNNSARRHGYRTGFGVGG